MAEPEPTTPITAPDDLAEQVGKEIGRARTKLNMSVSELHRKTGISRTVLQGYESGKFKPGAREIYLIARALNTSPNRLIFGKDDFRAPDPLDSLLGATDKVHNAAALSIIFGILSREEQRAMLSMVSLLAEARIGGRDKLAEALKAIDVVLGVTPQVFGRLEDMMTPEIKAELAQTLEERLSGGIKQDEPTKPRSIKKNGKS